MAEVLAVDIGESFVGAAIERAGRPTLVELGSGRPFAPCALHLPPEGDVTVGEEADELAVRAPHLVARRFWRRLGDDIPFIVGGRAWPAEALVAEVLRWAARAAGVAPAAVTLAACRPLDWGEHFQGRLRAAAERAGFVSFVSSPSPLAAARWYLDQGALRAPATIAVYDFGGLGCDAAVVRVNERSELEPVGRPVRLDDVGGANLDHILYVLAAEALGLDVALYRSLDQRDLIEMEALRNAAAAAKERLSSESATTITANVHGRPLEVRITRSEFEERALGVIERTTASLRGALAGAGLDAEALDAIVVVGGASAVPLVSAVLAEEFGRPLVTDGHARAAALFGALAMARAAAPARLSPPVSPIAPVEVQRRTPAARFEPPTRAVPAAGPRPVAPPPERDAEPAPRSWGPPPAAATPAPSSG
ncbi:MAG: Hsp70 family protein, partial [Acidimicrobiales bacterium]